jgi:cell division protein FtsB
MPPPVRVVRQRFALVTAVVLSAGLLVAAVFGSRGLLHLRGIQSEEQAINRRITELLRENEQLRATLAQLKSDDRAIEKRAREELGFVRPGDLVYRFPPDRPSRDRPPDPAAPPDPGGRPVPEAPHR